MQKSWGGCCVDLVARLGLGRQSWLTLVVLALTAAAGEPARAEINYDFAAGAGVNRFAFKGAISSVNIPPLVNTTPAVSFTTSDYNDIRESDNARHISDASGAPERAACRFVFGINEPKASLTAVTVTWEGLTQAGGNASVYLWDAFTASYTLVGSTISTTDATVANTFTANPGHYIDSSSQLVVLVLNSAQNRSVSTDYIRVSLRQCESAATCDDGNACTTDTCNSGVCAHTNNSDACSEDGNACTNDVCSAGSCTHPNKNNGAACNDGNACTQSDTCQAGTCTGSNPVTCTASNDCHLAGTCNPATGACSNPAKSDGSACSDGMVCTLGDSCLGGSCQSGSAPDCSNAGDQCHSASCDPSGAEGNCNALTPRANGTSCDDDLFCTVNDACTDGVCGGSARDCSASGDQCHSGSCDEAVNACEANPVADGTACDDGEFCTIEDSCQSGVCGGSPRDCSASSDQCNTGVCNETLGQCAMQPVANGTDCDDLNACNVGETCQSGSCSGGGEHDCSGFDGACTVASCDAAGAEGNCDTITPVTDGTPCEDGEFCTSADSCLSGLCIPGATPCEVGTVCDEGGDVCVECLTSAQCNDGVACTDDTCNAGSCVHTVNDEQCDDDGLYCNGAEYCDAELGCRSTGDPCPELQLCDETNDSCGDCLIDSDCDDLVDCTDNRCVSGGCVYTANDENCEDDGQFCNGSEVCDTHLGCVSSGGPCLESEFCNEETDTCDECVSDADCDDGDPCTVGHSCDAGTCRSGHAVDCADQGNQCNVASCNPLGETGNCDILTPLENGTSCDDGSFCTEGDACLAGICAGAPRDCGHESDQCNLGVCDEELDACRPQPIADGVACDDALFCTVADVCTAGVCGGSPRDCEFAGNQCNLGVCNETSGQCEAQPVADGTACDDELFCTVDDVCREGTCRGGDRDCSPAADQCNTGVCNEASDACEAQPVSDGTGCDDNLFCTDGETCQSGTCGGGTPHDCSGSGDQCNTGVCNEDSNSCEAEPVEDGTTCDDGDPCTTNDSCGEGVCESSRSYGLDEWNAMSACLAGPEVELAEECSCYDLNSDGRIDMLDVDQFMRAFDGQ